MTINYDLIFKLHKGDGGVEQKLLRINNKDLVDDNQMNSQY